MTKKIFALIIGLLLVLCTSYVFASNNEIIDSMNKTGNTVKGAVEGVRNVVGNVENGVENGATRIGNGVKDLGNTFADGAARVNNDGTTLNGNNNDNRYTAARTSTGGTFMGMNGTTWTWFILAIAGLAIIGLVWYYAMQNDYKTNNSNH